MQGKCQCGPLRESWVEEIFSGKQHVLLGDPNSRGKLLRRRKEKKSIYTADISFYHSVFAMFFTNPQLLLPMSVLACDGCNQEFGALIPDLRFIGPEQSLCVEFKPKLCEMYNREVGCGCRFCVLHEVRFGVAAKYCPSQFFSLETATERRLEMLQDLWGTKFLRPLSGHYESYFSSTR